MKYATKQIVSSDAVMDSRDGNDSSFGSYERQGTSDPDMFYVRGWCVQPTFNRISSEDKTQAVEPRVMAVLEYLARHAGEAVDRDELVAAVWQGTVVSDNTVNRTIAKLRHVLCDDARCPRYIVTIAKKGYQLIAPVHRPGDAMGSLLNDEPHLAANGSVDTENVLPDAMRTSRTPSIITTSVSSWLVALIVVVSVILLMLNQPVTIRNAFSPQPNGTWIAPNDVGNALYLHNDTDTFTPLWQANGNQRLLDWYHINNTLLVLSRNGGNKEISVIRDATLLLRLNVPPETQFVALDAAGGVWVRSDSPDSVPQKISELPGHL